MIKCITCDQPLPEDQNHPPYLAQHGLQPHPDDIGEFWQGTDTLLDYLDAVFNVTIHDREVDEEIQDSLIMLARELTEEAQRRCEKLREAGEIWKERATGKYRWAAIEEALQAEGKTRQSGTPNAPDARKQSADKVTK